MTKVPAKYLNKQSKVRPANKFPRFEDATHPEASTQSGKLNGRVLKGRHATEAYVKEFDRLNNLVEVAIPVIDGGAANIEIHEDEFAEALA